ncbi:MAG TPA: hypothetical protein PL009_09980 [Flavipsychrobacter sp.]|nr:hypothetical protein [Flavipsychrobacter sp.]
MNTKFITDAQGKKLEAIIPIKDYEHLIRINEQFEQQKAQEELFEKEMKKRFEALETGGVRGSSWEQVKDRAHQSRER